LSFRSLHEVIGRILALHATIAVAFSFDGVKAQQWLTDFVALKSLSESEKAFLMTCSEGSAAVQLRIEALFALTWTLSLVDEISPSKLCPSNLASLLPNLNTWENPDQFARRCQPRALTQIARQADLYYCLHWFIRERRFGPLKGTTALPDYAIVERRRSLEWVLGHDDWDDVSLDT
jgi:hypothetical protein